MCACILIDAVHPNDLDPLGLDLGFRVAFLSEVWFIALLIFNFQIISTCWSLLNSRALIFERTPFSLWAEPWFSTRSMAFRSCRMVSSTVGILDSTRISLNFTNSRLGHFVKSFDSWSKLFIYLGQKSLHWSSKSRFKKNSDLFWMFKVRLQVVFMLPNICPSF